MTHDQAIHALHRRSRLTAVQVNLGLQDVAFDVVRIVLQELGELWRRTRTTRFASQSASRGGEFWTCAVLLRPATRITCRRDLRGLCIQRLRVIGEGELLRASSSTRVLLRKGSGTGGRATVLSSVRVRPGTVGQLRSRPLPGHRRFGRFCGSARRPPDADTGNRFGRSADGSAPSRGDTLRRHRADPGPVRGGSASPASCGRSVSNDDVGRQQQASRDGWDRDRAPSPAIRGNARNRLAANSSRRRGIGRIAAFVEIADPALSLPLCWIG